MSQRRLNTELKAAQRIIMRMQDHIEVLNHKLIQVTDENAELRSAYQQVCKDYEGLKRTHRLLTTREYTDYSRSGYDEEE